MDEFESLVACRNHWQWLWITGSVNKLSYPPASNWESLCACCEYVENEGIDVGFEWDTHENDCGEHCPLTGFAWASACVYDKTSPYHMWTDARKTEKLQHYAMMMVIGCNKAIEAILTSSDLRYIAAPEKDQEDDQDEEM